MKPIRVIRDGHTYLFLWSVATANKVKRLCGFYAASPEFNFTWHDAARVCNEINKQLWKLEHGSQPNI